MKLKIAYATILLPIFAQIAVAAPRARKAASKPQVLGRMQMAGDNGKFGALYTIGKANPVNVAVTKAAYTMWPINFDTNSVGPHAGEKMLRIDFAAHNPTKSEISVWYSGIKITAVGDNGHSYEMESFLGDPAQPGRQVEGVMMPAQRINLFCLIRLPANAGVQKLVLKRLDQTPVLRLVMGRGNNKIAALPVPFAAGGNGSRLASPILAQKNVAYPFSRYAVTVLETSSQTAAIDGHEPKRDERFLAVKIHIKNISAGNESIYNGYFSASLKDSDGETYSPLDYYYAAKRDDQYSKTISAGDEGTFRIIFPVPVDASPARLLLSDSNSNIYSFNLK